ncbi:hypothetical protein X975_17093, partial [Stegodyphus mimosarum]
MKIAIFLVFCFVHVVLSRKPTWEKEFDMDLDSFEESDIAREHVQINQARDDNEIKDSCLSEPGCKWNCDGGNCRCKCT